MLDPEIFGGPGHVMTADGRSSIALCGGWEMSLTCRRGDSVGAHHLFRVKYDHRGHEEFWCEDCDMPLHPIGPSVEDNELMSIEPHLIEEIPW